MDADRSSAHRHSDAPGPLIDAELTRRVIGCYYEVYNALGNRFVESVYATALRIALTDRGLTARREVPLSVQFRGRIVGQFRADLVVEERLILELKAVPRLDRTHDAQLINYLQASGLRVGLLLNFGGPPEFRRLVLSSREERSAFIRADPRSDEHR